MIDCKSRFLKLEEKEKKWEKDAELWAKKEKDFETKQAELEKGLKEKNKDQQVQVIWPSVQSSAYSLSLAMSQVSLRYLEITGLKNQNKILEDIVEKREHERKKFEYKCKELVEKNNKLAKQVLGQLSLQGEKHLIWDVLIAEAAKLWPYLDFILDKDIVTQAAK